LFFVFLFILSFPSFSLFLSLSLSFSLLRLISLRYHRTSTANLNLSTRDTTSPGFLTALRKDILGAVFAVISESAVLTSRSRAMEFPPPLEQYDTCLVTHFDGVHTGTQFVTSSYSHFIFGSLRKIASISTGEFVKSFRQSAALEHESFTQGLDMSFYCYTQDKRYVIKSLKRSEFIQLKKILFDYQLHLINHPDSLIVRYLALHSINIYVSHSFSSLFLSFFLSSFLFFFFPSFFH
jgi:hypothetical protein